MRVINKTVQIYVLVYLGKLVYTSPDESPFFRKTAIELDVKNRKTTRNVVYRSINGLEIYNAKGNIAFNLIREGENVIWKETKEQEWATRVEVGENKLTIRSPSTFAVYFKNDEGIWHYSGNLDTVLSFSKKNIKEAGAPAAIAEPGEEFDLREKVLQIEEDLRMLREDYEHMRVKILFADSILDGIVEGLAPF